MWIETFLMSGPAADNRGKLKATHAPERHIFVGASFTSPGDAFFALDKRGRPGFPPTDPVLPPEITHVWIWAIMPFARCLAWFPDRGWLDVMNHWATS